MDKTKHFSIVNNWMYYLTNYETSSFDLDGQLTTAPSCFKAFEHRPSLQKHLIDKYHGICNRKNTGGSVGLFHFWFELSEDNKELMLNWVAENYSCRKV